jgi:plastocyanin
MAFIMKKPLIIAIVLVILAIGGYAIWKSNNSSSTATSQPPSTSSTDNTSDTSNTGNSDSTSNSDNQSTQPKDDNTPATGAINITNNMFTPPQINIAVGGTVTWTNNDSIAHTVTDDLKDVGGPNSGTIDPGKTYSFKFTKAGSYQYHCEIHPSMRGTIVVK